MNIKKDILKVRGLQRKQEAKQKQFASIKALAFHRGELRHKRKVGFKRDLAKAGFTMNPLWVSRYVFLFAVILNAALNGYIFIKYWTHFDSNLNFLLIFEALFWTLGLLVVVAAVWMSFYIVVDLAIFKRRKKLEEVLPDFLQLVSANIRAGMTIDQSLWFAVRPRFGILAAEIEEVAKHTFAGEPLETALEQFVKKYDSKVLERAMNLLIEGVRAGGEIGDLLDKISSNIQETNIMKKEMAANVTTYVIFISFATVIAAPFLFGIATQLVTAITEIFSRVDVSQGAATGMQFSVSGTVMDIEDFKIFAIVSLMITSFFSSIIISTIQKGSIRAGIKYIPMFVIASVTLFLLVVKMFSFMVADFF